MSAYKTIDERLASIETNLKYLRESMDEYKTTNTDKCVRCNDEIWQKIGWLEKNQYRFAAILGAIEIVLIPLSFIIIQKFFM